MSRSSERAQNFARLPKKAASHRVYLHTLQQKLDLKRLRGISSPTTKLIRMQVEQRFKHFRDETNSQILTVRSTAPNVRIKRSLGPCFGTSFRRRMTPQDWRRENLPGCCSQPLPCLSETNLKHKHVDATSTSKLPCFRSCISLALRSDPLALLPEGDWQAGCAASGRSTW